jgi:hypothetical protein
LTRTKAGMPMSDIFRGCNFRPAPQWAKIAIPEWALNELCFSAGSRENENPFIVPVHIRRREEKTLAIRRKAQRIPDHYLAIAEFHPHFTTGAPYFVGIVVLAILVALKIFCEKNGFELLHIDRVRFTGVRFQVEKQFVREKIGAEPFLHLVVVVTGHYPVLKHG